VLVTSDGFVKRDVELVGQGGQPGKHVSKLMFLIVPVTLPHGSGELTQLFSKPRQSGGDSSISVSASVGAFHQVLQYNQIHSSSSLASFSIPDSARGTSIERGSWSSF
jgi:hypothetical protein